MLLEKILMWSGLLELFRVTKHTSYFCSETWWVLGIESHIFLWEILMLIKIYFFNGNTPAV